LDDIMVFGRKLTSDGSWTGVPGRVSTVESAVCQPARRRARRFGWRALAAAVSVVMMIGVSSAAAQSASAATRILLPVQFFSQRDSTWSGQQLGTCSGVTIYSAGCAVTSVSMVYKYYGISVTSSFGTGMNPGILNAWLTAHSGYASGCNIVWSAVPAGAVYNGSTGYDTARITAELSANRPVVAWVTSSQTTMHFVVITGQETSGAFDINDPWDLPGNAIQRTLSAGALGAYTVHGLYYYSHTSSYSDVIVDDQSGGFVKGGTAAYWHEWAGGYNNHMWWTYTNVSTIDDHATWTPSLPATGRWQVWVFIPSNYASTTNARYTVYYQGSSTTVGVNQNIYYNAWVSLGTWTFSSGSSGRVYLGDATGESSAHWIGFDAVKWVWVG